MAGGRPSVSGPCVVVFGDGPRSACSLQRREMAFYISQPKVRQAGFELPNKADEERQPSPGEYITRCPPRDSPQLTMLALPPRRRPAPAYDPSMYFTHNNFGSPFDAFNTRLKYSSDHAPNVDFADTLASMVRPIFPALRLGPAHPAPLFLDIGERCP